MLPWRGPRLSLSAPSRYVPLTLWLHPLNVQRVSSISVDLIMDENINKSVTCSMLIREEDEGADTASLQSLIHSNHICKYNMFN